MPLSKTLFSKPLASGALVLLTVALIFEAITGGKAWSALALYLLDVGRSVVAAGSLALPAFALGYGALGFFRGPWGDGRRSSWALSLTLGWGVMSLLLWALAALGAVSGLNFFGPLLPPLLLLAGLALGRIFWPTWRQELRERQGHFQNSWGKVLARRPFFALTAGAIFALIFLRLLLLSLCPAFQYDVLEYHLPLARNLAETGTFAPLDGNRYSQMPLAMESLYALARLWEGSDTGAKLLHFFFGLQALALLNVLMRQFQIRLHYRLPFLALFLLHPIQLMLFSDAFVSHGVTLYMTAALICAMGFHRFQQGIDLLLGAAFCALAFGAKYPAMTVAVLPWFALLTLYRAEGLPAWGKRLRRLQAFAVLTFLAGLVYLPWLVRALWFEASFFPPVTAPLVGADSPLRETLHFYHRFQWPWSGDFGADFFSRLPRLLGPLLAVPILTGLIGPERRSRSLALYVLLGGLAWASISRGESRFLAPLLPAALCLAALMVERLAPSVWSARLALGAYGLWAGLLFFSQGLGAVQDGTVSGGLGLMNRWDFLEKKMGRTARFFEALDKAGEPLLEKGGQPKALLVYEARFAALGPEWEVEGNTVFDRCSLFDQVQAREKSPAAFDKILETLTQNGVTHVAVNEVELVRLLRTYPAPAAWEDPAFQSWTKSPPSGFFFSVAPYYPPFYDGFQKGEARRKGWEKWSAFLEHLRRKHPPLWEEGVGAARMWVSALGVEKE